MRACVCRLYINVQVFRYLLREAMDLGLVIQRIEDEEEEEEEEAIARAGAIQLNESGGGL